MFNRKCVEICSDAALFESHSSDTTKKSNKIWANFCHFLGNRESQDEFKIKIATKELEETKYGLILCEKSKNYPTNINLIQKVNELGLIRYKILSTSIKNK